MGNHGSSLDDILAEDMHHWYNKFMKESPSGLITLFELKAILNLKGMNEDANRYVEQVFFTFDMDGVCSTSVCPVCSSVFIGSDSIIALTRRRV